jgi:hypothetical protein
LIVLGATLGVAWIKLDGFSNHLWRGGLAGCSLLALAVIVLVGNRNDSAVARALACAPVVYLGRISYGVYLWHWPIIVLANPGRVGFGGWPLDLLRVGLTLAVSALSFRYIEQPLRHGSLRLRAWVPAGLATGVLSLVVAWPGAATASPPAPISPHLATLVDQTGPVRMVVLGDSTGFDFVFALDRYRADLDLEMRPMADPNCAPGEFGGQVRYPDGQIVSLPPQCHRQLDFLRTQLREWNPDVVLFMYSGAATAARPVEGRWVRSCDPVYDRRWTTGLAERLDLALEARATAAVVNAPYARGERIPPGNDRFVVCQNRATEAAISMSTTGSGEGHRPGVAEVDLAGWVCPQGECRIDADSGELLRPDGIHFGGDSIDDAALWIYEQVLVGMTPGS